MGTSYGTSWGKGLGQQTFGTGWGSNTGSQTYNTGYGSGLGQQTYNTGYGGGFGQQTYGTSWGSNLGAQTYSTGWGGEPQPSPLDDLFSGLGPLGPFQGIFDLLSDLFGQIGQLINLGNLSPQLMMFQLNSMEQQAELQIEQTQQLLIQQGPQFNNEQQGGLGDLGGLLGNLPLDQILAGLGDFIVQFDAFRAQLGEMSEEALEAFDTIVETVLEAILTFARPLLGGNEVAEGNDLFPEPIMNINDDEAEAVQYDAPDDFYLFSLNMLDLSGTFNLRSELVSGAANLNFDRDDDDDDIEQVLKEMIDGDGGAVFDEERDPGIDNVELISITKTSYTLAFNHEGTIDVLTLAGPGTEVAIQNLATDVNIGDDQNTLGIIDLDNSESVTVTGDNPIGDIVTDGAIDSQEELEALLTAGIDPDDMRVELLGLEIDSFAVKINNSSTGAFDIAIFCGTDVVKAIDALEAGVTNPANSLDEFIFGDPDGTGDIATPAGGGFGPTLTEDELLDLLDMSDDFAVMNAIDQGDSVRIERLGADGTRDIIVIDTDVSPPGGAYDPDLFSFA